MCKEAGACGTPCVCLDVSVESLWECLWGPIYMGGIGLEGTGVWDAPLCRRCGQGVYERSVSVCQWGPRYL